MDHEGARRNRGGGWLRPLGAALWAVRPGLGALATSRLVQAPMELRLASPAFAGGAPIPVRYTADGEGLFPPLRWTGMPEEARCAALLVEDADAPFPRPLVHALLYDMPPGLGHIAEGGVPARLRGRSPDGFLAGRNSLSRTGWMPPAPVPGHGPHRYAFQIFALDRVPEFPRPPGRTRLMRAVRPRLIAWSRLIGTYERP